MKVISDTSHAVNEALNYENGPDSVFLVYGALNGKKPVWPCHTLNICFFVQTLPWIEVKEGLSEKFGMKGVRYLCCCTYLTDSASCMYLCSLLVCIVKRYSEENWRLVLYQMFWQISDKIIFIDIFQVSSRTASVCRRKGSSSFPSHYFCHWHRSCKCNGVNHTQTQNCEIGVMFWMYQVPVVVKLQANSALKSWNCFLSSCRCLYLLMIHNLHMLCNLLSRNSIAKIPNWKVSRFVLQEHHKLICSGAWFESWLAALSFTRGRHMTNPR